VADPRGGIDAAETRAARGSLTLSPVHSPLLDASLDSSPHFQRFARVAAGAVFVAVVFSGCGSHPSTETARVSDVAAAVPGNSSDVASTANPSSYGPPVEPIASSGIHSRVTDGHGVTVVNLWATWCAPCRREMPALLSVARAHKADGVRLLLVSVDFDDQLPAVRKFLAGNGVDQTTYFKNEPDQTFINAVNPQWSGALPATLVYDRKGKLVEFWEGAGDENRFEHAVIAALTSSN